jgi:hypothetical protein
MDHIMEDHIKKYHRILWIHISINELCQLRCNLRGENKIILMRVSHRSDYHTDGSSRYQTTWHTSQKTVFIKTVLDYHISFIHSCFLSPSPVCICETKKTVKFFFLLGNTYHKIQCFTIMPFLFQHTVSRYTLLTLIIYWCLCNGDTLYISCTLFSTLFTTVLSTC